MSTYICVYVYRGTPLAIQCILFLRKMLPRFVRHIVHRCIALGRAKAVLYELVVGSYIYMYIHLKDQKKLRKKLKKKK